MVSLRMTVMLSRSNKSFSAFSRCDQMVFHPDSVGAELCQDV